MKKVIRINIEIEKEFQLGMNATFKISNSIFTDYETLFDYDHIAAQVKESIKKLSGYDTLTIDVQVKNDNDFSPYGNLENSWRFKNKYNDECKRSHFNGHSFAIWTDTTPKQVYVTLKDMIQECNRKFIELIKEQNNCPVS